MLKSYRCCKGREVRSGRCSTRPRLPVLLAKNGGLGFAPPTLTLASIRPLLLSITTSPTALLAPASSASSLSSALVRLATAAAVCRGGRFSSLPPMFAASVSLALRRSAAHRSAAFLLPPASSAAWSSAAGPSLRAQQQLSRIFPSLAISRSAPAPRWPILLRAFSMSPTLATPRPGLLRRKHLGRIPHLAKASGPKTHTGAKKRFKSYKNGTVRRPRAASWPAWRVACMLIRAITLSRSFSSSTYVLASGLRDPRWISS